MRGCPWAEKALEKSLGEGDGRWGRAGQWEPLGREGDRAEAGPELNPEVKFIWGPHPS